MGHYVPHTDAELAEMLAFIGLSSLDELFDAVPAGLRLAAGDLDLAPGLSEFDALAAMEALAAGNRPCGPDLLCLRGPVPTITRSPPPCGGWPSGPSS